MHIPLNNLIKLALGPSLIKYDNDSVQIWKNENRATSHDLSQCGDTATYCGHIPDNNFQSF